ncbi:hypothetical protein HZ994_00790 [Akkermansiaceae bacterium]|nr:hypothetical protein HZ994_00790 [Akkermansiaceae bacterium]
MKKKILIGIFAVILASILIGLLNPMHERSGAFSVPIRIEGDIPLVSVEYKSIYEGESLEDAGGWREIEKDKSGNYIVRVSYVMVGSDLADEENYTYANRIFIRLSFEDGGQFSVISPLKLPDDSAEINIFTKQPKESSIKSEMATPRKPSD